MHESLLHVLYIYIIILYEVNELGYVYMEISTIIHPPIDFPISNRPKVCNKKLSYQAQKCCVAVAKARKLCPAMLTCTTADPFLDD